MHKKKPDTQGQTEQDTGTNTQRQNEQDGVIDTQKQTGQKGVIDTQAKKRSRVREKRCMKM